MTRTREMQIQQLEMQGRKRRGRPPGSKNKPKSDVSGGMEIREFFSSAVHVLSGCCLLARPAQGWQQGTNPYLDASWRSMSLGWVNCCAACCLCTAAFCASGPAAAAAR